MVKDGSALERLAEIDTVAFDKTGTLTSGTPQLLDRESISAEALQIAGSLASASVHPVAKALAATRDVAFTLNFEHVREVAGMGLEGQLGRDLYRLGRPEWAVAAGEAQDTTTLAKNGRAVAHFTFGEHIRPGARELVSALKARNLRIVLLSGDGEEAVNAVTDALGIEDSRARLLPSEKAQTVLDLQAEGRKVLMIGDGINDAPALRSADASMAPAFASDVGRNAADFVFFGNDLLVVTEIFDRVERAAALIRQNFALAILYNLVSLPIAFMGYVTP